MNVDQIYAKADAAGKAAVEKLHVVPMIVGHAKGVFGNDIDYSKPTYYVEDGVCGFAWVTVKPANSKFAKWLKQSGLGRNGTYGGVSMWIRDYNQSLQKKEAYASAFARVLNENGINAYSESRMD